MNSIDGHIITVNQIELIKDKCNRINGMVSIIDHETFVNEIKNMLKEITDTLERNRKEE